VASDVWKLGWAARGLPIEKALGGYMGNFPVIDSFLNNIATSIKSIDLNANVYQNAARLTSRINAYVDEVASFNGKTWGEFRIRSWEIEGRALNLAIPKGSMTAEQQAAIASQRRERVT
jgi:filamentous hemagglutinin